MAKEEKKNASVRSVEKLHHFSCPNYKKWWSVADAPASKKKWFCPWCGIESVFKTVKQ